VFIEISRLGAGLADILRPSAGPGGAFLGEEALGQGRWGRLLYSSPATARANARRSASSGVNVAPRSPPLWPDPSHPPRIL